MAQIKKINGYETPEEVIAILGKPDVRETTSILISGKPDSMLVFRYRADRRPDEYRQILIDHGADPDQETTLGFMETDGRWQLRKISVLRPD